MDVVAFIHAKGSSERVPNKNIRHLGNKPLFLHAIHNALAARTVDAVVIDSENDCILNIGKTNGAVRLKRPLELATNDATGDDLAYWQASNFRKSKIVLQVVPTSPFIGPQTIDAAVNTLRNLKKFNSVVGCRRDTFYTWVNGAPSYFDANNEIPNSQDLPKTTYETTGLYINRTEFVLKHQRRLDAHNCLSFMLSKIEAIDINTEDDFRLAEIVWRGLKC